MGRFDAITRGVESAVGSITAGLRQSASFKEEAFWKLQDRTAKEEQTLKFENERERLEDKRDKEKIDDRERRRENLAANSTIRTFSHFIQKNMSGEIAFNYEQIKSFTSAIHEITDTSKVTKEHRALMAGGVQILTDYNLAVKEAEEASAAAKALRDASKGKDDPYSLKSLWSESARQNRHMDNGDGSFISVRNAIAKIDHLEEEMVRLGKFGTKDENKTSQDVSDEIAEIQKRVSFLNAGIFSTISKEQYLEIQKTSKKQAKDVQKALTPEAVTESKRLREEYPGMSESQANRIAYRDHLVKLASQAGESGSTTLLGKKPGSLGLSGGAHAPKSHKIYQKQPPASTGVKEVSMAPQDILLRFHEREKEEELKRQRGIRKMRNILRTPAGG